MKKILILSIVVVTVTISWFSLKSDQSQAIRAEPSAKQTPLKVGTNIWIGYEPLYLAAELGYYSKDQIELVEFSNATQVLQAYKNKLIDVAALTLDEVLMIQNLPDPPQVFLIVDFSNGADSIVAKPEFTNLAEVQDKRIGVENTAMGGFFLTRAFQASNLSMDNLTIVPLSFGEHQKAYEQNQVDALVTFDPTKSQLIKKGAVEIFNSSQIPGEIVDTLVASHQTAQNRKEQINQLVRGWDKALVYLKENPNRATEIIAKRLQASPEVVKQSYLGITLVNSSENLLMMQDPNSSIQKTLKSLPIFLTEKKLLHHPIDHSKVLNPSFAQASSQSAP